MTSLLSTHRQRRWHVRGTLTGLAVAGLLAALPAAAVAAPASSTAPSSAAASSPAAVPTPAPSDWPVAGGNISNTHNSTTEKTIGTGNVANLKNTWSLTTGGDMPATPTVVNGYVYTPDFGGNLSEVQASTGQQIWSHKISDYTGVAGDVSRTSPAYADGELVIGDGTDFNRTTASGAFVSGIDATTGQKLWNTQVDSTPAAIITGSPVIYQGVVYVGVSSKTELVGGNITFRGSMVALNAKTGKIIWQTFTVPTGYTGGAIWSSSPLVDPTTGQVYTGTGNNYTTPPGVCTSPDQTNCTQGADDNDQDSIIAFDMKTGAITWATHTLTADTWTIAMKFGPDFDFGTAPGLFNATIDGKSTQLIGLGQKSGVFWALDPVTGKIVWNTAVGPGGEVGGIEWDSAEDGNRIYVPVSNSDRIPTTITSASGQTSTISNGFWAALDPSTGKVLWETAAPNGSFPLGFVSSANGVLYGGTVNPTGNNMYALDGATGAIKWSFASGGSVLGGAAIVNGTVYWDSGYPTQNLGFPGAGDNNKLFAFSLPPATTAPQTAFVAPSGTSGAADTSCSSPAFNSVNAAVNAVASGGHVVVCDGTFKEDVAVNKPLQLEGRGNATIDATNQLNGIAIEAPNVTVTGFTVENAVGEGILVNGVNNATIENNIVENNDLGAGTGGVANSYPQCAGIQGTPADCGAGIHLMGSSNSSVTGNTSRGNAGGILVSDETGPASQNEISSNSVLDNPLASGITLAARNTAGAPGGTPAPSAGGVFGNTVTVNTVEDNGLTAGGGGVTLTSLFAGGAVYNNTVSNNIVSGNAFSGVTVHSHVTGQDLNGNVLTGNQIGGNNTKGDNRTGGAADSQTTGVLVSTVSPLSIQITGNTISSNHFGVWTLGPVTAANDTSNTFSGVTIPVSAN